MLRSGSLWSTGYEGFQNVLFSHDADKLAIVHHRGRRSGREYRTPVMTFPTETGYVIALTYGRDVDWVKNLMDSDSGSLKRKGDEIPIHGIRFVKLRDVKNLFPFFVRLPLNLISVEDCLLVETSAVGSCVTP